MQLHGDVQVAMLGAVVAGLLESLHPGFAEPWYAHFWHRQGTIGRVRKRGKMDERADPSSLIFNPLSQDLLQRQDIVFDLLRLSQ